MRGIKFTLVFLILCSMFAVGQRVHYGRGGYYNYVDTTSIYSSRYVGNLSRITGMMNWIEGVRSLNNDSVYLGELNTIYSELNVYCKPGVNYALVDKRLFQLEAAVNKAWKNYNERMSPYGIIRKELLAHKRDATDELVLNGIRLYEDNKRDSAYQYFKKAVEKEPGRWKNYYFVIMDELQVTNDTAKAFEDVEILLKLNNGISFAGIQPNLIRAWIYEARNQHQLALDDINKVLEKDPQNVETLYDRGYVKERMKDYTGANSDFQQVLSLYQAKPVSMMLDSAILLNNIAWNYYLAKQYELCVEYANKSLLLRREDSHTLDTRGSGYYGLGEYQKCIDDMTDAIRLSPELDNSWYLRGMCYLKLNKKYQALTDLSNAAWLGLEEATDMLKELSRGDKNTEIEKQRQFPVKKPAKYKDNVIFDAYGLHFMLR